MADLTTTPTLIGIIDNFDSKIESYIADAALTAGQAVYTDATSGKSKVASAAASGTAQFRGIALQSVGAGSAVDVLERGRVYGFTVTQNYDAPLYLSNTSGAIADAAGTVSVPVGRVVPMADSPTLTKVVEIFVDLSAQYA